jgi:hypothetical protein
MLNRVFMIVWMVFVGLVLLLEAYLLFGGTW